MHKEKIRQHLNIPSPLSSVETSWTKEHNISLFVKRDDLIHPLLSGNKWRKLSGILAHYDSESYDSISTYGGAFSNHLVATAVCGSILGIPCEGIIRGEEPKERNSVLRLCALYGMRLTFISRGDYKKSCRTTGIQNKVLYVPEGGADVLGTVGCKDIVKELDITGAYRLFVPCGTGTTLAGMAQQIIESSGEAKLFGIQVLKGEDYIKSEVKELYGLDVDVYDNFHGGGYAKTNEELVDFIREFTKETGILLDPIYTGKMMLAIKKMVLGGEIEINETIVAVHTGGLTGWFGKHTEL